MRYIYKSFYYIVAQSIKILLVNLTLKQMILQLIMHNRFWALHFYVAYTSSTASCSRSNGFQIFRKKSPFHASSLDQTYSKYWFVAYRNCIKTSIVFVNVIVPLGSINIHEIYSLRIINASMDSCSTRSRAIWQHFIRCSTENTKSLSEEFLILNVQKRSRGLDLVIKFRACDSMYAVQWHA